MISRKAKLFRVNRGLAADFEKTCTLLGVRETNAVEQAIHDWVKKNIGQATLEAFTMFNCILMRVTFWKTIGRESVFHLSKTQV